MTLTELLNISSAQHQHICPRQVLGVRMGLLAGQTLGLTVPQTEKRLITFVETDGCFADGVSAATGCWVGRRTMRLLDFGKTAATFVDSQTQQTVRIYPALTAREQAASYAADAASRWEAYLLGYQRMPDDLLLVVQPVALSLSLEKLISREKYRVNCAVCGEEIFNEREVYQEAMVLCRACAGESYYEALKPYLQKQNLPANRLLYLSSVNGEKQS